ncbi:hypothetical protein DVA86_01860 [Streptomyces armeniacus]|uniref:Uncharacterized protein n=1 Tax=Streptomyces armeniacus TaxID=83291 RepID=A0A345XZF1_9ACTN|nr:hypothetical protein DVA86_01860 [Streptomyces armeniacus]
MAAAGCGGSDGDDGGDGGSSGKGPSRTAGAAEKSGGSSPSPSVTAADGSDTGACADGNCEVTVSKPVTFPFKAPGGRAELSVTKVGPNAVDYTVKRAGGGTVKGGASGTDSGCISALRSSGGGTSCGRVGSSPPAKQDGAVLLQVASGADGTAVVTLVSG